MSKKKKNANKPSKIDEEDYQDLKPRKLKKSKRRSERHWNKKLLDDITRGRLDEHDYEYFQE